MESETYCVLYGEIVLAKEMSLAMALRKGCGTYQWARWGVLLYDVLRGKAP